jgi:predicted nuclease of restriction endonuclease-like (RecB) superfamily
LREAHSGAIDVFKDVYPLELAALSNGHFEADLHGALLRHLGRFITELGRDFCFAVPVIAGRAREVCCFGGTARGAGRL